MNKQLKTISSVVKISTLAILLTVFSSSSVFAGGIDPLPGTVSIKYVGSVNHQPVFQVQFENQSAETYNVAIKDELGNVLYTEKSNNTRFSKKFQFERPEGETMKLTFTLTGENQKLTQSFEVNSNVRVIEDVTVTKL